MIGEFNRRQEVTRSALLFTNIFECVEYREGSPSYLAEYGMLRSTPV